MPRSTQFKTVPLNLAGASYESRTRSLSAQRTVNFYPEYNRGAKSEAALQPFPNLSSFATPPVEGADRGAHVFKGVLYQLIGSSLYSISSSGAYVLIGSISGFGYASFADNGSIMMIVADLVAYSYDGSSFTQLSYDVQPTNVSYLNNQFILDGVDGRISTLDVGSTDFNALNYATPESAPDPLVASYVFNQLVFLFGETTIEPWENTGIGNPPFERMGGAIIEEVGLAGKYAVAHTADAMYFIGSNGDAYKGVFGGAQPISKPAQAHAFQGYERIDDCIASFVSFEASKFIIFTFPTANKTWVYSETVNDWFELESGFVGNNYQCQTFLRAYNKNIAINKFTGEVYMLDLDSIDSVLRERVIQGINGELISTAGARLQMSRLWLTVQANGNIDGQGKTPRIMIQPSYDGGRTWGREYFLDTGRLGQHAYQVRWDNLHTFYDMVLRIRITDPVYCSIIAAAIDLREAGY